MGSTEPRELAPGWQNAYVGILFAEKGRTKEGCDCWGLVRLVLAEAFGIDTPLYGDGYESIEDRREICRLIQGVLPTWTKTEAEEPGGVILLRTLEHPRHCGIVVKPGEMLHILPGVNACIESYRSPFWRPKVLGFYQWAGDTA